MGASFYLALSLSLLGQRLGSRWSLFVFPTYTRSLGLTTFLNGSSLSLSLIVYAKLTANCCFFFSFFDYDDGGGIVVWSHFKTQSRRSGTIGWSHWSHVSGYQSKGVSIEYLPT